MSTWTDPKTGETFEVIEDLDLGDFKQRYTAQSTEPDDWKVTGLMRLDLAVTAVYMQLLRGSVKNTAGIYRRKMDALKVAIAKGGIEWAVTKKLTKEAAKKVTELISTIVGIWRAAAVQAELEKAIRRAAIQTQRQVKAQAWNQTADGGSKPRGVVRTRR